MKDILINYPIKFLQQELINVRTNYRLEKTKITEILRTMKSIKKLDKEQLIDLLIKYNYDISKLPKLEDLIKPKKEKKTRAIKPKGEPKPRPIEEPKPRPIEEPKPRPIEEPKPRPIEEPKTKPKEEPKTKPKEEPLISTGKSEKKNIEELTTRRDDLLQKKKEIENKQFENLNKYEIQVKKPSGNQFIKMKDDYKKDKIMWSLEAIQKGISIERILEIIFGGGYKQLNAFFTPDSVIETMLDFSFYYQLLSSFKLQKKTFHILETSGGVGNIIYYMLENTENISNIKIDFVEVDLDFISIAQARLFKYRDIITYHHVSFFDFETDIKYDYIIGNPPFKISLGKKNNIYDVDFFNKSYNDFLDEGSRIVFVMSTSAFTLKTESHKEFKKIINDVFDTIDKDQLINQQSIIELKNKFSKNEKGQKPVSTNINTEIFIVDKPYED